VVIRPECDGACSLYSQRNWRWPLRARARRRKGPHPGVIGLAAAVELRTGLVLGSALIKIAAISFTLT